jgi:membrane fusion protein, multidrug efflux system
VSIKPRIDSQIATVNVAEGALVKEGDLLFTLDARSLKAQLAQADAQIEKDRAQLEQGRRDLARAEDLLAKRISTEVQRDTAKTTVKVLEAQLAADEAQRANLAALVSYTEIRSPVSGRIGSIALKEGSTVRAGDAQAIATVNQIDPIYVSFAVPQSLFPDLRTALQAGTVQVNARVGESVTSGPIAFVENTVDVATGTVLAKALLPNKDEKLWPGVFVAVEAVLGIEQAAIAVPSAAVQLGQQGAYVFVVNNGRAQFRKVSVARTIGQTSVIEDGLSGGEQIVIDGQLRLVDGAAVQVQPGRSGEVARTPEAPPAVAQEAAPRRS